MKDWAALRAQFVDELLLHIGKMKSAQRLSADAYVNWAAETYGCGTARHSVRFHEVRIDLETGNHAVVTSYWQSSYRRPDAPESEADKSSHFWCDHTLVRTSDGWKIEKVWATTLEDSAFSRWSEQVSAMPERPRSAYR